MSAGFGGAIPISAKEPLSLTRIDSCEPTRVFSGNWVKSWSIWPSRRCNAIYACIDVCTDGWVLAAGVEWVAVDGVCDELLGW